MKKNYSANRQSSIVSSVLLCLILAFVGAFLFSGHTQVVLFLAGIGAIVMLLKIDLARLKHLPSLFLLGYVVFSALTGFWALSGKFFLREYSKIFIAAALFLLVIYQSDASQNRLRKIMTLMAGTSAVFAALSVEAATTRMTQNIFAFIPEMASISMDFETGTRLTGIFGNANIMASILALGIFFSIALLCDAKTGKEQTLYAIFLSLNAFVFLLSFSMGGIACFAVAIIAYLIFSGKHRGMVLVRMLEGAIPAILWGFASFPFFNRSGFVVLLPLVFLVCNAVSVLVLERKAAPRMMALLEQRQKLVLALLAGLVLFGIAYVLAGYHLNGPFTFQDEVLRRSAYPEEGTHTLSVDATGEVQVTIISQNMSQVMMHTSTKLYQGSADQAEFTVPENSEVCYFTFSAPEGVILSRARLNSGESLRLKYTLLPGFIANRLQGLWANQNAIQRTVFFRDGMELFFQRPLLGNGVGSVETGVTSVQDFYYESRYVHNHYIQILAEAGLPGFLLYVGTLFSLAVLLLKRRAVLEGGPLFWVYPALWAAWTMIVTHPMVEVSMSTIVFLCYAFLIFGLIVSLCPSEAPVSQTEDTLTPVRKKKQASQKKKSRLKLPNLALAALPALFLMTVGMNVAAERIGTSYAPSLERSLANLSRAAALDPYEANDYKMTYVLKSLDAPTPEHKAQADQYAAELMRAHSNSLPLAMCQYYLATEQYWEAIEAAKAAAVYSSSNAEVWNAVTHQFRYAFAETTPSPLSGAEGPALLDGLLEYYNMLQERNRTSMEEIRLEEENKAFFQTVIDLAQN